MSALWGFLIVGLLALVAFRNEYNMSQLSNKLDTIVTLVEETNTAVLSEIADLKTAVEDGSITTDDFAKLDSIIAAQQSTLAALKADDVPVAAPASDAPATDTASDVPATDVPPAVDPSDSTTDSGVQVN